MNDNNQLNVYDEFVAKHEAAYAGFTRIYESKTPRPIKGTVKRDLVSTIIIVALTIVMAASIWVSASRTISEFGGGWIGFVAFVMIDCGIMVYALFRARRTANAKRLQNTVKWATAGLFLTFIIGVGANIDAALSLKGIMLPDTVNVGIHFLVAISAPTLAFISSDVLAIELMAGDIKRREADALYETLNQQWLEGLNRSWATQQQKWDVRLSIPKQEVSIPNSNGISIGNPMEAETVLLPSKSTIGHSKAPDASQKVEAYLLEFPDAIHKPLEIARNLGVGKSTVYNVIKRMQPPPPTQN